MHGDGSAQSGKREQNKARNRAEILEAARSVFAEIGYDAASIRDVVARTGLAPGTFYNYFPDKRSVLVALVRESGAEGARRVREARARATSLEEFVYNGFRAYFEFVGSHDRITFELMRRNVSTLRSLGLDETGFTLGLAELRSDLKTAMASGLVPNIPIDYAPAAIGAVAFEVGALMVACDPPDIDGATVFASELCLGAIDRLSRLQGARPPAPRKTSSARERAPAPRRRQTKTGK
ncbi:MAG TPA: TetR/AcrR family transcriptional regulator [Polyangiales bacterium]|nr:TetR/AcrR family transcriptional regulator [Polyangiales bacterium]